MPVWARVTIVAAAARTALAISLYLSGGSFRATQEPIPLWAYATLSATFTILGLGLAAGNRRDARAAWLGGIFVLAATPLVTPLLNAMSNDATALINIRPDAFLGLFLWCFLERFPDNLESRHVLVARVAQIIAAAVGAFCALVNLAAVWIPIHEARPWLSPFIATARPGLYWPLTFGVTAPGFPMLFWRAHAATTTDRWRVRRFVGGLLIGLMPFVIEVIVEQLWPSYRRFAHRPDIEPWIGAVLFGGLASVPFLTAYSVLFDRIVEVRVVLRAALQYALARYTVVSFVMVPFGALIVLLIRHRDEPLSALLVQGARATLLGGFGVLGFVALRLRVRWLEAVDRRYFRESYSADQILAKVVGELSQITPAEICRRVSDEIDRALHAEVKVFLVDLPRTALTNAGGWLPPLSLGTTLAHLVLADGQPMDVDLESFASPLQKLPPTERLWLKRGDFRLLVAMRGTGGEPRGLVAMTAKRSGLPYSQADRRFVSALASAAALALDSQRLRRDTETAFEPPALECHNCSRLADFETAQCECGGRLSIAAVPRYLRGVFQLERRIGAGGMGVVYQGIDLNLHRLVAIKALPRATREHINRLRREAQAMAAVSHPNLAIVYGIETWQEIPLIVQEYVAGGTLTDRLKHSRMSIPETLDLGLTLAGCLEYLHSSGIVHCDIKPGNIGFSASGTVKLLDFGLVRLLRDVTSLPDGVAVTKAGSTGATDEETGTLFGTPQFMSPEARRGESPTPMFDLWALSVVLYECICGARPFEREAAMSGNDGDYLVPLRRLEPDGFTNLTTFFEAAFAPDPTRRPANAAAFRANLLELQKRYC